MTGLALSPLLNLASAIVDQVISPAESAEVPLHENKEFISFVEDVKVITGNDGDGEGSLTEGILALDGLGQLVSPETVKTLPPGGLEQLVSPEVLKEFTQQLDADVEIDWQAFAQAFPAAHQLMEEAEAREVFDEYMQKMTAQQLATADQKTPQQLAEAFARLEVVSRETPGLLQEIFAMEKSEQGDALDKLLFSKENSQLSMAGMSAEKQALLAEFSQMKGKIFRIKSPEELKVSRESQGALLQVQASGAEGQGGSIQADIDSHFREGAQLAENREKVVAKGDGAKFQESSQSQAMTKADESPSMAANDITGDEIESVKVAGLKSEGMQGQQPNSLSAKPTASAPAQQVRDHLQAQISPERVMMGGNEKIMIQLHPASLGRVEIQLEMLKDGAVKTVILAERPETLSLLRQDVQSLKEGLMNSGFSASSDDFLFQQQDNPSQGTALAQLNLASSEEEAQLQSTSVHSVALSASHAGEVNLIA